MVDITTRRTAKMLDQSFEDEDSEEMDLSRSSMSSERVKQVVTASVLASLSIAVAPVASFVPRMPVWGIALFDPVSIFWVIAFLVGGYWVGLLSSVAGTLGLFLYDPTAIGPIFKLLATLPMILIPFAGVQKLSNGGGGESLSKPKFYATLMVLAFLFRLIIMIPINLIYASIALPFLTLDYVLGYAIILNAFQSVWDALIPFIIVHRTGIFKNFGMW